MKYVVILLFLINLLTAAEWNQYFVEGNKFYADGKYEEAIEQYNKILSVNMEAGEVYFNLGNCYYKLDQIGQSILYYEKAKKYLAGDEALEQNLRIAQLKTIDEIEPIPKLFLVVWWEKTIHLLSIENLGWITLFLFIISSIFISLNIIMRKRLLRRLIWISLIFLFLFVIIYAGRIYEFETTKFGVIFDKKISVKSEPSLGAAELFILHEGTKVKINRDIDDWYEITIADGKTGWCKSHSLGII